ncbi:MAG: hypothetical protein IJS01_12040 [Lentisphaeria bacterium]|nr:hypothetical protein [Lentisphaeria bacterium]
MENFIRDNCRLPVKSVLLPMIVPCGKKLRFFWRSLWGYLPLGSLEEPSLRFLKHDGGLPGGKTAHWEEHVPLACTACPDGGITFEVELPDEGQYDFEFFCGRVQAASAQVFAAEEDLFSLTPFKGDFHAHSENSDGMQTRAFAALRSRRQGLDFTTITDHRCYCSQEEAERTAKETGTGVLVLPGEEIHLPCAPGGGFEGEIPWFKTRWVKGRTPVHLVNAGGTKSVNDLADNDLPNFNKDVSERCARLPRALSAADRWSIASSEWAFEKIRAFDGLAIFPHPFWNQPARLAVSDRVRDILFADGGFDAVETVNGCFGEECVLNSNMFRTCGAAPVSGSDRHDFGKDDPLPFTVVFAERLTRGAILDAVRKKMCCSAVPVQDRKPPILTGDMRLVRYVLFLLKNFFPRHDGSCLRECLLHPASGWEHDEDLQKKAVAETRKWYAAAFSSGHDLS